MGTRVARRRRRHTSRPSEAGQHQVQDQQVRPPIAHQAQGRLAVGGHGDLVARAAQVAVEHVGDGGVVVDHHDPLNHLFSAGRRAATGPWGGARGDRWRLAAGGSRRRRIGLVGVARETLRGASRRPPILGGVPISLVTNLTNVLNLGVRSAKVNIRNRGVRSDG